MKKGLAALCTLEKYHVAAGKAYLCARQQLKFKINPAKPTTPSNSLGLTTV
jgi:hypothetical protein